PRPFPPRRCSDLARVVRMRFIMMSVAGSAAAAGVAGAAADAEPLHHHARRAEPGERRLEQVEADERGHQPEPGRYELRERDAEQDHHAGEGHDGALERHRAAKGPGIHWLVSPLGGWWA